MRPGLFILPFLSIILAAFAMILRSSYPHIEWLGWTSLAISVLPVVLWLIMEREHLQVIFSRRGSKYGASSGVTVLLGIATISAIAYVSQKPRFNKSWDVTRAGVNTLSDQSIKVLDKIKSEDLKIELSAFFQDENVETSFRDLMALYEGRAPGLRVEYVDPRVDPARAMSEKVTSGNTVIVRSGPHENRMTSFNEERITNALMAVMKDGSKKVYFTAGHGEGKIASEDPEGLSVFVEELKNNQYEVETLNLAEQDGVPDDAYLLVIAGARYDLQDNEITAIDRFVRRGGSLLVMIDALVPSKGYNRLLKTYGLGFNDDLVMLRPDDPRAAQLGQGVAVFTEFDDYSPATRDFARSGTLAMLSINTRSLIIDAVQSDEGFTPQGVVKTSPIMMRIKDVKNPQDLANLSEDRIDEGAFEVIAISTAKIEESTKVAQAESSEGNTRSDSASGLGNDQSSNKEARVVVVGSSFMALNNGMLRDENRDMTVNLVNYLLQDEDFISIRPKDIEKSSLDMSTANSQMLLMLLSYFYPFAFLVLGTFAWLRRRNA